MNELGIALGWLAIQVTLAMLPAAALHLLASRRGPVAGSWMAAASLAMVVGISVLAFFPGRSFMSCALGGKPIAWEHARLPSRPKQDDLRAPAAVSPASSAYSPWHKFMRSGKGSGSRLTLTAAANSRWAGVVAWAGLDRQGWGLFRLLVGLWAVHECRRRGRRIDDAGATLTCWKRSRPPCTVTRRSS